MGLNLSKKKLFQEFKEFLSTYYVIFILFLSNSMNYLQIKFSQRDALLNSIRFKWLKIHKQKVKRNFPKPRYEF